MTARVTPPIPPAIFFDVDETLITVKSMFSFLEFYLDRRGARPGTYRRRRAGLDALAQSGASRGDVNRAYYAGYAGESAADLSRFGREWFTAGVARGGLFHPLPLVELIERREAGSRIYLVSGSFFACLDPIAQAVGATAALGTQVHIERGLLTGEVSTPMIGEEKARAALNLMAMHDLNPRDCVSYGDHQSDIPLLSSTGNAVVVGDDLEMLAIAFTRGWRVIRDPSGQSAEPTGGWSARASSGRS